LEGDGRRPTMQVKPRKPVIINQKGIIPNSTKLLLSPLQRSMQRRQPHREVIRFLPMFNGVSSPQTWDRDKLLLRDHVPCGSGLLEPVEEPLFLLGAQQRSTGIDAVFTAVRGNVASAQGGHLARLLSSVLSAIQGEPNIKTPRTQWS
jgi:hypothetical protein